jgi:hypothetical protein
MNAWKPALAVLLVFVAGLLAGVEGTRIIEQWHERQDAAHPQAVNQRLTAAAELQLARRLNLGPVQRPRVRQILLEMQAQLKFINQETQPRRAQVVSNAAAQIELILGPAQKRQFEILKQENRNLAPQKPLPPNNQ